MKKVLVAMSLASIIGSVSAEQLAFPGAEGFGRYATGGRGCEVYHVTNLNDSGTGSLRDAVSQPNRTVVFDVSGIIKLNSRLIFSKNLTVAGQTAPGDGVVVYGNGVTFSSCDNIIVRYMRFRMGSGGTYGADAAGLANGKNMMFDHLSVSWGLDENFSINWDNKGTEPTNITIQNSIIGQGILIHAMGGLMQTSGGVSILRNLYIDNKSRNPKVKGLNQFVNNVVYNWGTDGYILGGSAGDSWATIEDCYFVKGPNSGSPFSRATATFQLYQKGNYVDGNKDGVLDGVLSVDSDFGPAAFVSSYESFTEAPQLHPTITNQSTALQAYEWIAQYGGASLPTRDQVDQYLVDEMTSYGVKGALINGETELALTNNVGLFFRAQALKDSDGDGMPDVWEDANSLDKNNASDGKIVCADGYTNLEHYLNGIVSGVPFLKYPINITASNVTTVSANLNWKNMDASVTVIKLEQSADGVNFQELASLAPSEVSYALSSLQPSTKYYYRIKVANDELESSYSDVFSFKTMGVAGEPETTTPVYPLDGNKIPEYKNLTLNWSNPTSLSGGYLYYTVYMGTDKDNLELMVEKQRTNNKLEVTIEPLQTYYWKVICSNTKGTDESEIWSFTTSEEPVRNKSLYIPFDESEGNAALNVADGSYAQAVNFTPSWIEGVYDNAISFDGTQSSAMVLKSSSEIEFADTPFSIELWFKSAGGSSVDWYLMHKGSHTADSSTGATGRWTGIQYRNSILYFCVDDNSHKSTASFTASSYFNNVWNQLVCIRDVENSKLYVYVNGELKVTATDSSTKTIASDEDLVIGNRNVFFDNPFKGAIDELSIYDEVLTEQEIKNHYNEGKLALGIDQVITDSQNMNVYPNPFTNQLYVNGIESGINNISIYDASGRLVLKESVYVEFGAAADVNVSTLSAGFYTLVVESGNTVHTQRVIKTTY